jgi:hypothetical protein
MSFASESSTITVEGQALFSGLSRIVFILTRLLRPPSKRGFNRGRAEVPQSLVHFSTAEHHRNVAKRQRFDLLRRHAVSRQYQEREDKQSWLLDVLNERIELESEERQDLVCVNFSSLVSQFRRTQFLNLSRNLIDKTFLLFFLSQYFFVIFVCLESINFVIREILLVLHPRKHRRRSDNAKGGEGGGKKGAGGEFISIPPILLIILNVRCLTTMTHHYCD